MYVSVTATRQGVTPEQLATVERILTSPKIRAVRLTHGDAIGGDAQLHDLAVRLGLEVHIRPSTHRERAWSEGAALVHEPKQPLDRNWDLAEEGWLLIACPASKVEERRSGTWSTVRYAREVGARQSKGVIIVFPDGKHRTERFPVRAPAPPPPESSPGAPMPDPSLLQG